MKLSVTMCHTHLMSMLMKPAKFQKAVHKYSATSPNVEFEGIAGYIETKVEFEIASLKEFTELYEESYTYPSNRGDWYDLLASNCILDDK